jgi:NAD(P)-dependent dehydrogenase (short-subunit alcohol dehydrogenase family)
VVACPDKDTCAHTMTTLAADFTPADGAWAVTPMKLDMCSLRSIKQFVAAVAAKYEQIDMLVLDAATACSNMPAASPKRLGDGVACPQMFVGHTALLHWLRPLLVHGDAHQGAGARAPARVVGVTGPLQWLASVTDTDSTEHSAGQGQAGGMNLAYRVLQAAWGQQVERAVGRAPYEALGRLLFPAELARQWRNESRVQAAAAAAVEARAVGVGLVRFWRGVWLLPESGWGDGGAIEGWEGLVGEEWWVQGAMRAAWTDGTWADMREWVQDLARWEWGVGWLGVERWQRMLAAWLRLWAVCEGIIVRPSAVAVRPVLKALLDDEAGAGHSPGGPRGARVSGERDLYMDAEGQYVGFHPGDSWRGVDLWDLSRQWWAVAHERIAAFEAAEKARDNERRAGEERRHDGSVRATEANGAR